MNARITLMNLVLVAMSGMTAAGTEAHTHTAFRNRNDTSDILEKTEIELSYPGGDAAWRKFPGRNLRGDVAAENGAAERKNSKSLFARLAQRGYPEMSQHRWGELSDWWLSSSL